MTPTQPNSSSSPFPATLSQDQQLQLLYSAKPQEVSSSSSLSSHVFTYSIHDQRACHHRELHLLEYQQQAPNFASHGGSHDHSARDTEGRVGYDQTGCSAKWMSSKMRLMKKMMINPDRTVTEAPPTYAHQMKFEEDDQKQPSSPMETDHSINNNSSSNNSIIRVCADCNTTKTPLWRSGPKGPKTLCNACGIRQRKARRAMAAAAASANDTILAAATSSVKKTKAQGQHTDKRSNNGHGTQFKKRSKLPATPSHGREKLCFEDFLISLSKNLAFHQVFPQDEKEAAILLMALSCGLVHG